MRVYFHHGFCLYVRLVEEKTANFFKKVYLYESNHMI